MKFSLKTFIGLTTLAACVAAIVTINNLRLEAERKLLEAQLELAAYRLAETNWAITELESGSSMTNSIVEKYDIKKSFSGPIETDSAKTGVSKQECQ